MPMFEMSSGSMWAALHDGASPLVLVHGAGGSHLDWSPALRRVSQLVVDLPGHGKSPAPGYETISAYAAAVMDLLAFAMPGVRPVIAGHSMGGAIAQMLALDFGERIAGLILVGTGAKLSVHPDILGRVREHPEEVGRLLHAWLWGDAAADEMRDLGYAQFMKTPPEVIYGDYLACNTFDVRARLSEIRVPTLVIAGSADRMTPPKYSAYLKDNIAGAELVTIEGGGHMMALEQPEAVSTVVRDWLDKTGLYPHSSGG